MKKILFFLSLVISVFAKDFGIYKSIDEKGKETAQWHIYEENGELYGKIVKLIGYPDDEICNKCEKTYKYFTYAKDASKMKLVGAPLLYKLQKESESSYKSGYIIDPESGKLYRANATFKGNKLILRGYVGFSLIGRSQTWIKVK